MADYFKDAEDPHIKVIPITLLAVMNGAEDYGHAKQSWLKRFIALANGIPGHNVFRRVFCRLIPQEIGRCFMAWMHYLKMDIDREVIAVDGKTMKGSVDKQGGIKAAYLVSAWATENRMVLVQMKTDDKSKGNEVSAITAIPEVLRMIALKRAIVMIDAADFSPYVFT